MGQQFLDQYSILHFSSGAIAYFWGIDFFKWFVIHASFEVVENTEAGMKFINENLTWWPGGKPKADKMLNVLGDNAAALFGWWVASQLDKTGKEKKWYSE